MLLFVQVLGCGWLVGHGEVCVCVCECVGVCVCACVCVCRIAYAVDCRSMALRVGCAAHLGVRALTVALDVFCSSSHIHPPNSDVTAVMLDLTRHAFRPS